MVNIGWGRGVFTSTSVLIGIERRTMTKRIWEEITSETFRLETENGWLIKDLEAASMVYLSDRDKTWVLDELPDEDEGPVIAPPPPVQPPLPSVVPSAILNMRLMENVYESAGWLTVPSGQVKIAAVQFNHPEIKYGSKVSVTFKRRGNYPLQGNLKPFRVWAGPSGGYPNFYLGRQVDGSYLFYVEKLTPATGVNRFYIKFPEVTEEWREEKYEWTVNSSTGATDGKIKITIGGQIVLEKYEVQFDGPESPGVSRYISVQENTSNIPNLPAGSFVEFRDVQVDVQ